MSHDNIKPKIPVTVRVLTLNCADTLERCLKSLQEFDEILMCDGNSTDGTLEIGARYSAHIIKQYDTDEPNIPIRDWPEVVNRCTQAATNDWVFYLDSDEAVSQGLVDEIRAIVAQPAISHYIWRVPNRIIYQGREILYATPYPGYQMRFINKKSGARYERSPHYQLVFDASRYSVGTLRNPWYVFVERDDSIKFRFVLLDALAGKGQTWSQFVWWSVWKKLWGMAKIIVKILFLYLRHGFADTLPPRVELMRLKYKGLLFVYLMRQRFLGENLVRLLPKENR